MYIAHIYAYNNCRHTHLPDNGKHSEGEEELQYEEATFNEHFMRHSMGQLERNPYEIFKNIYSMIYSILFSACSRSWRCGDLLVDSFSFSLSSTEYNMRKYH